MPHLKKLHEDHKDAGLVIIGVHTANGSDKMAAFVTEQGITYPVAVDTEGKTKAAYGINSIPDYCLIDKTGKLRFADLANGELGRAIEYLLAE